MIRLIWNAFLLCIIAVAAVWMANNPGFIRIDWMGYRIETTASLALTVLIIIGLAYHYFLAKPLFWLGNIVTSFAGNRRSANKMASAQVRKETEKYILLERASACLAAGDVKTARKLYKTLDKKFTDDREQMWPFEAKLEEMSGNGADALLLYAQMAQNPETRVLGVQGQVRLHRADGQYDMALALLKNQLEDKNVPPAVLKEAFEMQIAAGRYDDALVSLEKAQKENAVDKAQAKKIKAAVLLEQALSTTDKEAKERLMRAAADNDDTSVQAVLTVAGYEAAKGDVKKARSRICRLWKKAPCVEAYKAYIALEPDLSAVEQVKSVEKLISENPTAVVNDLVLADVSVQAGLPGQAKTALTKYLSAVGESRTAFNLLVHMAEASKDTEAAVHFREKALMASEEKPFVCDACKTELTFWHNICPVCHKPGQIRYDD